MSFDVNQLYAKLSRFYWSPKHPSEYVIRLYGKIAGVGLIAHQDYAAFNYAWAATHLSLDTEAGQRAATFSFVAAQQITKLAVEDADLGWQMTRQSLPEFKLWYAANWKTVPRESISLIRKLYNADEVQALQ